MPFSSHQWKALAVRRISRKRLLASALITEDLRCLAMGRVVADPGIIIVGGMGAEELMTTSHYHIMKKKDIQKQRQNKE